MTRFFLQTTDLTLKGLIAQNSLRAFYLTGKQSQVLPKGTTIGYHSFESFYCFFAIAKFFSDFLNVAIGSPRWSFYWLKSQRVLFFFRHCETISKSLHLCPKKGFLLDILSRNIVLRSLGLPRCFGTMRLIEDFLWKKLETDVVSPLNLGFWGFLWKYCFPSLKVDIFGYCLVLMRFLNTCGRPRVFSAVCNIAWTKTGFLTYRFFLVFSVQQKLFLSLNGTSVCIFWHLIIIGNFQWLNPECFKHIALFEPWAARRLRSFPA